MHRPASLWPALLQHYQLPGFEARHVGLARPLDSQPGAPSRPLNDTANCTSCSSSTHGFVELPPCGPCATVFCSRPRHLLLTAHVVFLALPGHLDLVTLSCPACCIPLGCRPITTGEPEEGTTQASVSRAVESSKAFGPKSKSKSDFSKLESTLLAWGVQNIA